MVTAELAVAIPSVVLVLALCLVAVEAAVDQIRCIDAARIASRAAARGDDDQRVRWLATQAAPSGARVAVSSGGGMVRVTVTARTGGWGALPGWDLEASAETPTETAAEITAGASAEITAETAAGAPAETATETSAGSWP